MIKLIVFVLVAIVLALATTRVSAAATATVTATAAVGATATATATAGSGATLTVTATNGTSVTRTVTVADAATSLATATATAEAGATATSTATASAPSTAGAQATATATSTAAAGATAVATATATANATAAATAAGTATAAAAGTATAAAAGTATAAAAGTATARATALAGYSATAAATAPVGATVTVIVTLPATDTINSENRTLYSYLAGPQQRDVPILNGKIVGGTYADIRNHPYQVSLQYVKNHICGGALISSHWVLTASHCVESPILTYLLTVRVGSATRGSGGQVIPVLTIISHPDYTRNSLDYDIALLRLASSISATNAQAIPLPHAGTGPTAGSTAVITGWEALSEESSTSTNLQVIEVPVVSQTECRAAYSVSSITDKMFCAGRLGVDGKKICQGDSGSPVVVNGTLVGLASWGRGCALADYPGVYTNVHSLKEWVYTNSGL